MTPEYLRKLADLADPDQLWRLTGLEQLDLPPDKRKQLDAGVALRRHASHIDTLRKLLKTGRSLLITPLSENGTATKSVDTPPDHGRLRGERTGAEAEPQMPLTAQEWLKEAERRETLYSIAQTDWLSKFARDTQESIEAAKQLADSARAALLDHLAARPQEQEAKEAARYRWLRRDERPCDQVQFVEVSNGCGAFGAMTEDELDSAVDDAIAAEGKTA